MMTCSMAMEILELFCWMASNEVDEEIAKMGKEEARLEAEVDRASKKLANKGFVDHAPVAVVEKEKGKLAEYESQLAGVRDRIKELKESR